MGNKRKPEPDCSKFSWPETGDLDIMVHNDWSVTARYFPSERIVEKAVEKFTQKPLGVSGVKNIQNLAGTKTPHSGSDSAFLEGVQNGEIND